MPPTSLTQSQSQLTLNGGRIAMAAAEAHASTLGIDFSIAIVDASTHLLHFSRMPDAKITSISIAVDKAFTAAGQGASTGVYKEVVWPGGVAFGLGNTNGGRFITFAGGLPIVDSKGVVIGGIGASSGTPSQDQKVAAAGKEAVERAMREEEDRFKSKL